MGKTVQESILTHRENPAVAMVTSIRWRQPNTSSEIWYPMREIKEA